MESKNNRACISSAKWSTSPASSAASISSGRGPRAMRRGSLFDIYVSALPTNGSSATGGGHQQADDRSGFAPEDRESTLLAAGRSCRATPACISRTATSGKDGQIVHIMWSARWSEENQVRIAIAHDITPQPARPGRAGAAVFHFQAASASVFHLFRQIHLIIGIMLPAHRFTRLRCTRREKDGRLNFRFHADQFGQNSRQAAHLVEAFAQEVVGIGLPLLRASENLASTSGQTGQIGDWLGCRFNARMALLAR